MPLGVNKYRKKHARRVVEIEAEARKFAEGLAFSQGPLVGASATDYWFLNRYILTRRPNRVLELGGGKTTFVISNAMAEIGAGTIVSVDHVQHFSDETKALLSPELASRVQFVVSHVEGARYDNTPVLSYADVPAGPYNLIFVDGPPIEYGGVEFPSIDALHALTDIPADIVVDRRFSVLTPLAHWINKPVYFDPILDIGFIEGATKSDLTLNRPIMHCPLILTDLISHLRI